MKRVWLIAASACALTAPWGLAQAQSVQASPLAYGNPDGGDSTMTAPDGSTGGGTAGYGNSGKPHKRTRIVPYLEVDQTVYDQTGPAPSSGTYTTLAAGADMLINSRSTTGVATVRYEHHFSETRGQGSSNTVTGVARLQTQLVPHMLTFDFGGLATHTAVGPGGSTLLNPVDSTGSIYQIWSLYAGPSLATHAGIVDIKGGYNVGYNEIDQIRAYVPSGTTTPVDLFGHSLTQQGTASVGVRPAQILPFGVTLLGSYLREDISNLDQVLIDERLGGRITQPVTRDLALVGDVGWEKVNVSQRNALVNANGSPVVGANGQYVTDPNSPRAIAYNSNGLTWDAGVEWRPSKRTFAAAFVGRRYDSTTYYGSFYHAPNSRSTFSLSVFDGIYGFGSGLTNALQALPTDFTVSRDPFSGNVAGCFLGSTGGGCVTGALGSANALVFHARGGNAAYSMSLGRLTVNVGGGYVTRRFFAAPDTVLAGQNGLVDETWYVNAGLSGPIDRHTRFTISSFASLYHTDQLPAGDTGDWGVNGMLVRHLTDHLVGTASVEVLGVSQQISPDQLELLGQLGLRYNFK